ncbi:MAG: hypothetical protein IJ329_02415 [Clostridia bacterium]|nr:hypothetical protein [Clostridia bacterium]
MENFEHKKVASTVDAHTVGGGTDSHRVEKMGHYGSDDSERQVLLERPCVISATRKELLSDLTFSKGFSVTGFHSNSSKGKGQGYFTYDGMKAAGNPDWKLAQWGCLKDIITQHKFTREGNVFSYDDGGKYIRVNTDCVGQIDMGIKGSVEYSRDSAGNHRERISLEENWPHILIEQMPETRISRDCRRLYMEIDYVVDECRSYVDRRNYPVNPEINAAQFQWFLLLQDGDENSPSFGHNMWFGFSMFDTRSEGGTPKPYQEYDGGKEDSTGYFIYMPTLRDLVKNTGNFIESVPTSVVGKRVRIKIDIIPELQKALDIVQGYGELKGASVGKLKIISTNIGWEIPGNYDVSVKINYLNMYEEY